jgi:ComF family protein
LRSLFSVFFPSDCRLCRTPLDNISRIPVCRECLAAILPTRAPQCVLCGDRLAAAALLRGDDHCPNCREFEPEFERALSFGEYHDELRGLIHLLKYEGVTPAAAPLGAMLAQPIAELLATCRQPGPLLIPVPLHNTRRRSRGFNQSQLLARSAARKLAQPVYVVCGALVRQRDTASQVGLTRAERIENMRGAFDVAGAERVRGREIIVVDDVMTTGTTLSECARVLKEAGAERVWAATVARAYEGADARPGEDPEAEEVIEVGATSV